MLSLYQNLTRSCFIGQDIIWIKFKFPSRRNINMPSKWSSYSFTCSKIADRPMSSTQSNKRRRIAIWFRKLNTRSVTAESSAFIQAKSDAIFSVTIQQRVFSIGSKPRKIRNKMDEYRDLSFLSLCRLCGVCGNHSIDIFGRKTSQKPGTSRELSEKIFRCVEVRVSVDIGFSWKMDTELCIRIFTLCS